MASPPATKQETLTDQLDREKRTVSYDAYDVTIRQLVDMAASDEIDIAPDLSEASLGIEQPQMRSLPRRNCPKQTHKGRVV